MLVRGTFLGYHQTRWVSISLEKRPYQRPGSVWGADWHIQFFGLSASGQAVRNMETVQVLAYLLANRLV